MTTCLPIPVFLFCSILAGTAAAQAPQQKATTLDRATGDYLGESVAVSGEWAIAGSSGNDLDAAGGNWTDTAGAAYIFRSSGGTWTQQQKLVAPDRATGDRFGAAVDISGDYAIVGAPDEDHDAGGGNPRNSAGSAYIFMRTASGWMFQQKIVAPDREAGDLFGSAVAVDGDYVIVGAYEDDEDAAGANTLPVSGSAYIFKRTGTA